MSTAALTAKGRATRARIVDAAAELVFDRGVGRTTFPLQAWPDIVFFNALMDWTDGEGRRAVGEVMDFYGVADLTDLQAKRGMGPW